VSDSLVDGSSIELPPAARRARPVARRIGWVLVAVSSLLIGTYAVLVVASGFALVPEEVASNRSRAPSGYGSISSRRALH
jgi:hypothetical protein